MMVMTSFLVCFIWGIILSTQGTNNELPVWFHLPLCHNVDYGMCPASPASTSTTTSQSNVAGGSANTGGCCRAYPTFNNHVKATEISKGTAYPAASLNSRWFGPSEFRSGLPKTFDYRGTRTRPASNPGQFRSFNGECDAADSSSNSSVTGATFKFKLSKKVMEKDMRYMPKILRTEGIQINTMIIKVNNGKTTKTYDLTPVPNVVTTKTPYTCGASVASSLSDIQGPTTTQNIVSNTRRLLKEELKNQEQKRRRRHLLKGGSRSSRSSGSSRRRSSNSYDGYEPQYRSRRGTTVVYMGSGARTRTNYGYESKKHVQAIDSGISVEIDYPSLPSGTAETEELRHQALLGPRKAFVGSRPDAAVSDVNKFGNYYTDYEVQYASRKGLTTVKFGDINTAALQTVYDDLTGSQFGEDKDDTQLLKNDGSSDWEFEVSFRGQYDPFYNVVKRKDTKFPHVYVTFVTPDDNGKEGLGWALIIIAILGSLAFCFVTSKIDETDFPDVCGSDNVYSEPSSIQFRIAALNSSVQRSPSDGSNDSSSSGPINTSEFKAAIRNFDRQTKGLGSRVLRKNNGDHRMIPVGQYYSAIIIPSNDVRSLDSRGDQAIQHIDVNNNDVSSLRGINTYQSLEVIILTNNNISNLGFQGASNNLKILKADANDIRKLFPGGRPGMYAPTMNTSFPNLFVLEAPDNDVDEISGLASNCPRLQALNLQNNSLGQKSTSIFDELKNLTNLEYVNLANNDIKPLGNDCIEFAQQCSRNLKYINLQSNDMPKSKLRQMRDVLKRRGMTMSFLADDGTAKIIGDAVAMNPMGAAVAMPSTGGNNNWGNNNGAVVTVQAVSYVDK